MRYYIGVDVHKRFSQFTVTDSQGEVLKRVRAENSPVEFIRELWHYCRDGKAVIETTNNWTVVYDMLTELGLEVSLAHAQRIKAIAHAKIKTDRIDADILADLLRADLIPEAYVRSKGSRSVLRFLRQRLLFVKMRTMTKNHIHALVDRQRLKVRSRADQFSDLFGLRGMNWLREVELPPEERTMLDSDLELLGALNRRVASSDHLIAELAKGDERVEWMRSIPGIGPFFSVLIVHEIDDISRFPTGRHLCSYCGLVPIVRASGDKIWYGPLSPCGNRALRWALIEAAIHAGLSSSDLGRYYRRLRRRKDPKAARTATARRLAMIIHALLKEKRPFIAYGTD